MNLNCNLGRREMGFFADWLPFPLAGHEFARVPRIRHCVANPPWDYPTSELSVVRYPPTSFL
jgi:hypothetical protein